MSRVVVVGGGVAGCAAAIALRRAGIACTVLEREVEPRARIGETLPPAARVHLERLGLWEAFVASGHRRCHANVSTWGGGDVAVHNFLYEPQGSGWHLDRAAFDAWWLAQATGAGVEVHRGATVTRCARVGDEVNVDARCDGRGITIVAQVVIDASGASARIARQLGGERCDYDRMVGWALRLVPGDGVREDDDGFQLVEPVADGWWYATPLPSGEMLAVLIGAQRLRTTDVEGWRARLAATTAVGERCAAHRVVEPARPWPVIVGRLVRAAGRGWLAVGDAASACDPLAAAGMTHAMASAIAGVDALLAGARGIDEYCREIDRVFELHLDQRARFYRAEPRWADSPFWARRSIVLGDAAITLDPALMLEWSAVPRREVPRELGTSVAPHEWRRASGAGGPRAASMIAQTLGLGSVGGAGDRRVVSAVQAMLACGTLRACG